jgi:hypothetical protein
MARKFQHPGSVGEPSGGWHLLIGWQRAVFSLLSISMAIAISATTLLPQPAEAHPGGQDKQGGHFNRSTGEYHCHREPCFSQHQKVEQATRQAEQEQRQFVQLYNRKDWPHWIDADEDCQNTRAEILVATSQMPVKTKKNKGCTVTWGRWYDPYTDAMYDKASDLDIDHIVPLAEAHRSGGYAWTREQRREFANDPLNLMAVEKTANREKSDQSPDNWLPPNREFQCRYIAAWLAIKEKYQLKSDATELAGMQHLQSNCHSLGEMVHKITSSTIRQWSRNSPEGREQEWAITE